MGRIPRCTSSPWGLRKTPLMEQCSFLAGLGMEAICGQFMKDAPGLFPPDIDDEGIEQALQLVRSNGLRFASFNAGGDFTVPAEELDRNVAHCCRQIDRAARFEPSVIIVFAGWRKREDDAVYAQVAHALKRVARHAAGYKLTVALENHGGVTATIDQCNRILSAVGEPNIGLNYDPANFLMYGQDPWDALVRLDAPLVFTHLKSLRETEDGGKEYCRVRDGILDYAPILAWLRREYNGYYGLEYEDPADVLDGTRDDREALDAIWTRIENQEKETP